MFQDLGRGSKHDAMNSVTNSGSAAFFSGFEISMEALVHALHLTVKCTAAKQHNCKAISQKMWRHFMVLRYYALCHNPDQ